MSRSIQDIRSSLSGRYRVVEELGRGGMGVVFLAKDPKHDRDVAVKVLDPELSSRGFFERFEREIRVAANLNHPHIVPVYDSGEIDGIVYYVMPRIDGETLADRIARGPVPIDEVVRIAEDVAAALDHSHAHGVVHRDIKPANIFLSEGQALVADFGIAKSLDPSAGDERLTRTRSAIGSPRYMSPEQLGDSANVGPRSDAFSFGAVLFESVTGGPPFGEGSPGYPGWLTRKPGPIDVPCPEPLKALIYRLLHLDPDQRLSENETLSSALRHATQQAQKKAFQRKARVAQLVGAAFIGVAIVVGALAIDREGAATMAPAGPSRPIVTTASQETDGRMDPESGIVSFLSDQTGVRNVWMNDPETGEQRQLTFEQNRVSGHVWSEEGSELAYLMSSPTGSTLRLSGRGPAGKSIRLPGGGSAIHLVRWIGSSIYFVTDGELWRYEVTLDDLRPVSAPGVSYQRHVDVRADQGRIVFADAGQDLWVADLDGGNAERLTDDETVQDQPCWVDREGSQIAFLSNRNGQLGVWRASLTNLEAPEAVIPGPGVPSELACSPGNGTLLVAQAEERADLWTWSPSGAEVRLTDDSRRDVMVSSGGIGRVVFQRSRPTQDLASTLFDGSVMSGTLTREGLTDVSLLVDHGAGPEISEDGAWLSYLSYPSSAGAAFSELWVGSWEGETWKITDRFAMPAFRFLPPLDWDTDNVVWGVEPLALYYIERLPEAGGALIARARMTSDGPISDTVLTFPPSERPLDLAVSKREASLAFIVRTGATELHELRVLPPVPGARPQLLYRETRADELFNAGWLVPDESILVVRLMPSGVAEPLVVGIDGSVEPLPRLDGGLAGQARIDFGKDLLLMPVATGERAGLYQLSLRAAPDAATTAWTLHPGARSVSNFDVLPDGRLLYVRHEVNTDIWSVDLGHHTP